jgi:hypothetical protein
MRRAFKRALAGRTEQYGLVRKVRKAALRAEQRRPRRRT